MNQWWYRRRAQDITASVELTFDCAVVREQLSAILKPVSWVTPPMPFFPLVHHIPATGIYTTGLQRGMMLISLNGQPIGAKMSDGPDYFFFDFHAPARRHVPADGDDGNNEDFASSEVTAVFQWPPRPFAENPSWGDVLSALGASFAITAVSFPLGVTVKVGSALLAIALTVVPIFIAGMRAVWCFEPIGPMRKLLFTVGLLICIIFAPLLELSAVFVGVTVTTVVIPYWVIYTIAFSHESSLNAPSVATTVSEATIFLWMLFGSTPYGICAAHLRAFTYLWNDLPFRDRTSGPEPGENTNDIPGLWDLLCGLLFTIVGLMTSGLACVFVIVLKLPVIFAQACYRYGSILLFILREARNPAACIAGVVVWTFGMFMKPVQITAMALCFAVVAICASVFVPAYLAAGWLWVVERPVLAASTSPLNHILRPLRDGLHGCHFVIWVVDVVTTLVATWHFPADLWTALTESDWVRAYRSMNVARLTCVPKPRLVAIILRGGWSPVSNASVRRLGLDSRLAPLLQKSWENFFAQCRTVGLRALRHNYLSADLLRQGEPAIFLGIPGAVVLRLLRRSPHSGRALELADGFVVDHHLASTVRESRAQQMWEHLMEAKEAFDACRSILFGESGHEGSSAGNEGTESTHLGTHEAREGDMGWNPTSLLQALEVSVLMGNGEPAMFPRAAQDVAQLFENDAFCSARQRRQLMQAQAAISRVAIELTKLPMFQSMFAQTLEDLVAHD
eukprot:GEMP01011435.1.p1 GENE.GEMP01011435.1~~GEMP01011435.1.p1  ORF type:complete len:736 (-),score=137.57 GEMP01011435.1:935-3142(-)